MTVDPSPAHVCEAGRVDADVDGLMEELLALRRDPEEERRIETRRVELVVGLRERGVTWAVIAARLRTQDAAVAADFAQ